LFPAGRVVRHWRAMAVPNPAPLALVLGHDGLVLGHASGFSWDEGLLVMAPLVVIGGLLWLANRRAARAQQAVDADDPGVDTEADAGS
jgi:uncharacterized membrane protein